jgi:hypothetical protein
MDDWMTPNNDDSDRRLLDYAYAWKLHRYPLARLPLYSLSPNHPDEAEINFMDSPPTIRRYVSRKIGDAQ